jgi:PEP-CTERM motif
MQTTKTIVRFTCSILALATCLSVGRAGPIEGSAVIPREALDLAVGQVYIYGGGFFAPNETVTTFSFLGIPGYPGFDFSGQRYMTPLLFEETAPNVFVVRGIGAGETVTSSGSVQSFSFNLQEGLGTTTSGLFTFGFINALVDASGNPTATSAGTVSLKETVDPGAGLGGPLTNNDWVFTPSDPGVVVGLNTSFGRPGTTGTTFVLNNPAGGDESTDRTYSASLDGFTANVPEPGTLALGGLGLLLAGAIRRRKVR